MNRVDLLLVVHKGKQVPLQLRKIEHMMQKKIWESRELKHDVTIPKDLRLDLFAKYIMSFTLSLKSSKKSLGNAMWEVAFVSRSHASLQEQMKC